MKARGEDVHARAIHVVRSTGMLDPNVRVYKTEQGPVSRVSRNAFIKNPDNTCILACGIKLPIITATDGTGSMGENVAKAFESMKEIFGMLRGLQSRYQIDLSQAVMQDIGDPHDVFQMSQFESDNRAAEHVRLLLPDKGGGDNTEDYDLGLGYLDLGVNTDINQYGLKGYLLIIADADGRGSVSPEAMEEYFGFKIQGRRNTKSICQSLLKKWHLYFIEVDGGCNCTSWWSEQLGGGDRIIQISNADLLAEVEAGLIYVTETLQPDRDGLEKFLLAGDTNKRISSENVDRIWNYLQSIKAHFGEQARLPGYNDIPKPGDVFAHYRDPWPINHPRARENPSAGGSPASTTADSSTPPKEDIPWNNL
jgi:hypothetical protein